MTGQRPLENVSYAVIADARKGARARIMDIACPVCGPQRQGHLARRKVLRTWQLDGGGFSLRCVRCELRGWIAPDGSESHRPERPAVLAADDDEEERKRQRNAELAERIWRQASSIAGTAGEAYLNKRGIDLSSVPDHGGLRWHPRCPWEGETTGCIISRFTDAITGEPRGIHRRPINGQKPKTLGPMRGCVIRLWPDGLCT